MPPLPQGEGWGEGENGLIASYQAPPTSLWIPAFAGMTKLNRTARGLPLPTHKRRRTLLDEGADALLGIFGALEVAVDDSGQADMVFEAHVQSMHRDLPMEAHYRASS